MTQILGFGSFFYAKMACAILTFGVSLWYNALMVEGLSSTHNYGHVSKWQDVTDLRQDAEDALWRLANQLIDDRHVLEDRIRILERRLREAQKQDG
jgi:hypothetical protein